MRIDCHYPYTKKVFEKDGKEYGINIYADGSSGSNGVFVAEIHRLKDLVQDLDMEDEVPISRDGILKVNIDYPDSDVDSLKDFFKNNSEFYTQEEMAFIIGVLNNISELEERAEECDEEFDEEERYELLDKMGYVEAVDRVLEKEAFEELCKYTTLLGMTVKD